MLRLEGLPLVHAPAITAAQMAEVDRAAVEIYGLHLEMLMENASRAIAMVARAFLGGSVARRPIIALAGPGNNGGDALGATRHLLNWGAAATVVIAVAPERLRSLPLAQYRALAAIGVEPAPNVDRAALAAADLILDGLLGYSASGAPHGDMAAFIEAADASGAPILAIDIPSGLDPDTGAQPGACVSATATVTLGLPKLGLLVPRARTHVGRLLLADIAIPAIAYERVGVDARGLFDRGELVLIAD